MRARELSLKTGMFSEFWVWLPPIAAGIAARSFDAGSGLNGDEIFSIELASRGFSGMIAGSLMDQSHPPLYNTLLYIWIHGFGAGETTVRALGISLSVAFLLLSYILLRRFMSGFVVLAMLTVLSLIPLFCVLEPGGSSLRADRAPCRA